MIGAAQGMETRGLLGMGCTVNRTCGLLAEPNGLMSLACSADVLAPVSIFASSAGNPRSCNATHSSQPSLKSVNVLSIDASAIQA